MKNKGGRKRVDKSIGRGHKKGYSARRAAELAGGRVNNSAGQVVDVSDIGDTKTRIYYGAQADRARHRQTRNQAARRKRGCCNGYTRKYHA